MEKPIFKKPARICPVCRAEGYERGMRAEARHLHELKNQDVFVFDGDDLEDPENFYRVENTGAGFGAWTIRRLTKGGFLQPCTSGAVVFPIDPSKIPEILPTGPSKTDPFYGVDVGEEDSEKKLRVKVKKPRGGSVAPFVKELIRKGATDEEIVSQVRENFPEYRAWKICARVYRKQLGITNPGEVSHS